MIVSSMFWGKTTFAGLLACALLLVWGWSHAAVVRGEESEPKTEKYLLRHKLRLGEEVHSMVLHQAKTIARIKGVDQASEARTLSEKVWKVTAVNPQGDMTFEYRIAHVEMSQTNGDEKEIRYDSRKDKTPPPIYKKVAENLGKTMSTVVINSQGKVLSRSDSKDAPDLGMGDLVLPLPEEEIAIGGTWSVPRDTRVKLPDGTHKTIKIREQYELKKVQAGVATIAIGSQPITPLDGPEVESQVMQQLSNGELKFDLDAGKLISKELNWDDAVVGFSGAESQLKYNARYREDISVQKVARRR